MKNSLKTFFILVIFIFIPFLKGDVLAASLSFDKTTVSETNGTTFQIAVKLDPGSDSLNSTDIYVTYDSTLLKADSVAAGSLFPTVTNDVSTSGKVYIAAMVNDPASSISTAGTVATITFEGLKDGTGSLGFDCNLSKTVKDDINASNVLVCSQNGSSAVTIGAGGGDSGGTTATEPTTAPDTLPQTGVFDNVAKVALPGIMLLLLGGILRLVL